MTKEIRLPIDVELSEVALLKAGRLSCMYESGKLRYIRLGNTELIRMIYGAVRNDRWATLPYIIEDERLDVRKDSFSIQFAAVYLQNEAVYKAHFNIEGSPDNSISFSMKGEALASFSRNRIGICVHHPIATCIGQSVIITRPDNSKQHSAFPKMVSPHQPFIDIRQMEWQTTGDTTVQLLFEGDIFETEDQRNWSDSSYKTYSTPLSIPFPVKMLAGDVMLQQVKLTIFDNDNTIKQPVENKGDEKIPFPNIGYSRSTSQQIITAVEKDLLRKIPFHHYRATLSMDAVSWQQELKDFLDEAHVLDTLLELVIVFPAEYNNELGELLPLLTAKKELLFSILVLQKNHRVSPRDLLSEVYPLLKKELPGIMIGYGTDINFVEVNRMRPADTTFDFVSYGLHPQAHMNDTRSILENLDNQPDMIMSAMDFTSGKKVFVSPVTLKKSHDGPADTRQYTSLTAWWTLMSIQQLAMAGSITLYELFGDAGLITIIKNKDGEITNVQTSPVYEMLATIHAFQPVWIIKRFDREKIKMDGLLLENANGERLFFKGHETLTGFRN